jgi:hypothetical protein
MYSGEVHSMSSTWTGTPSSLIVILSNQYVTHNYAEQSGTLSIQYSGYLQFLVMS